MGRDGRCNQDNLIWFKQLVQCELGGIFTPQVHSQHSRKLIPGYTVTWRIRLGIGVDPLSEDRFLNRFFILLLVILIFFCNAGAEAKTGPGLAFFWEPCIDTEPDCDIRDNFNTVPRPGADLFTAILDLVIFLVALPLLFGIERFI